MSVLYRVNFKLETERKLGDWFAPQGLNAAMERVRGRMNVWDGPFRQRDSDEQWGPWRPFGETADRFKTALLANEIGDMRVMEPRSSQALLAVKKVHIVDVDYPTISSNATPRVQAFVHPVWDAFPQLEYWGCFNCRHIAGSTKWSEHAWADAIDLHPPTMGYGDDAFHWCMNNKTKFNITRVLWRVAGHFDHLHVDFDPDHSGTPPCA